MPTPSLLAKDYPTLRRKVEETLLLGQKKIEEAKVQTYWMTGKLINEHIKKNTSRSQTYGNQVIAKLAEDIDMSSDVLWRCVKFAKTFKILVARPQSSLTWTHYKKLITVSDEETRLSLLNRAQKSRWSSDLLAQKIVEEVKEPAPQKVEPVKRSYPKLIPRKGELYTYRLIELDPLHKKYTDALRIDVGFKLHQKLPDAVKNLKAGQIIESMKNEQDEFRVALSKRKDTSLFTYKAYVERVVDADTLYVDIDLGFKMGILQYLRLRGINSPEIDTVEGKKAKVFVERELSRVPYIILTSSRSDKYDRYLADVWYGEGDGERYLNGVLLEEGLAERME
jgi:endonuclease YncB( thermonuclease family)